VGQATLAKAEAAGPAALCVGLTLDAEGKGSGMSELVATFTKDESGATAIEYGLIVGLIALAMAVGASLLGNALNEEFTGIAGQMNNSVP
jgi:pilus assembly protein Flp/PilA